MVLQRSKTIEYEGLGAVSALAMAMFEQTGLRELRTIADEGTVYGVTFHGTGHLAVVEDAGYHVPVLNGYREYMISGTGLRYNVFYHPSPVFQRV